MNAYRYQSHTASHIVSTGASANDGSHRTVRRTLLVALGFLLLQLGNHAYASDPARIEVGSPEELLEYFERLNYTPESWEEGIREVPRAFLMQVGPNWRINSRNLPVISKKRIFFRALGPLVLRANEIILADRKRLIEFRDANKSVAEATDWVRELAQRYKVTNSPDTGIDAAAMTELLKRVDAVPPSLALAQGAEESGWGTSRFAAEGNALFGQWTWGGKGIEVKEQRGNKGDYKIAAFETPLGSIQAYMLNINSHAAYAALRERRMQMRTDGVQKLSGWELAKSLTSYSERGADYVESLHAIMRVNKLQETDKAILVDGPEVHIYPKQ